MRIPTGDIPGKENENGCGVISYQIRGRLEGDVAISCCGAQLSSENASEEGARHTLFPLVEAPYGNGHLTLLVL